MESRAHALIAVSFLVVFACGAVAIYWWVRRDVPETRLYEIVSPYGVDGLQPQARVTFKGLVVGHVHGVHFAADNPEHVVIRIGLRPDACVTEATYARLDVQGITGLASISLHLAEGQSRAPLSTSAENPARLPMRRGLLQSLEQSGRRVLAQAETLLERANHLLGPENRRRVARTLSQLEQAGGRLLALEERVDTALAGLPDLIAQMRQAVAEGRGVLQGFERVSGSAGDSVRALEGAAGSVVELSASAQALLRRLDNETLAGVDALTEELERTVQEFGALARELRAEPRRVIMGAPPPPPGPGEPGFEPPSPEGP